MIYFVLRESFRLYFGILNDFSENNVSFKIIGNEAQVCFFIIQLLLLKPNEFRTRVNGLMRGMHPEHWVNGDFYSHHMDFHRKFPEKFIYDENPNPNSDSSSFHHLPTYFGNVCLRFIPVFDIVVHR